MGQGRRVTPCAVVVSPHAGIDNGGGQRTACPARQCAAVKLNPNSDLHVCARVVRTAALRRPRRRAQRQATESNQSRRGVLLRSFRPAGRRHRSALSSTCLGENGMAAFHRNSETGVRVNASAAGPVHLVDQRAIGECGQHRSHQIKIPAFAFHPQCGVYQDSHLALSMAARLRAILAAVSASKG